MILNINDPCFGLDLSQGWYLFTHLYYRPIQSGNLHAKVPVRWGKWRKYWLSRQLLKSLMLWCWLRSQSTALCTVTSHKQVCVYFKTVTYILNCNQRYPFVLLQLVILQQLIAVAAKRWEIIFFRHRASFHQFVLTYIAD